MNMDVNQVSWELSVKQSATKDGLVFNAGNHVVIVVTQTDVCKQTEHA